MIECIMPFKVIQCGDDSIGCASYLINHSDNWYLIDTSLPSRGRELIRRIERHTQNLQCILFTHEHIDHAGAARALQERFNCPVFAHRVARETLAQGDDTYIGGWLFGEVFRPPQEIKTFQEGTLHLPGGLSLKTIHTPGHSPGSTVYIYEEEGALFSGDLLFCGGWVGRWDLPGGDLRLLCSSLKSLIEEDFRSLYPGHGSWCSGEGKYHLMGALGYLKGIC
ncbi:MAG: hypothetical protein DRN28_01310 [Thermoplasmata archaeon]|nr:MAG: hypothetical protein DRN28_01310 [Thermoplasmata archaeon]